MLWLTLCSSEFTGSCWQWVAVREDERERRSASSHANRLLWCSFSSRSIYPSQSSSWAASGAQRRLLAETSALTPLPKEENEPTSTSLWLIIGTQVWCLDWLDQFFLQYFISTNPHFLNIQNTEIFLKMIFCSEAEFTLGHQNNPLTSVICK